MPSANMMTLPAAVTFVADVGAAVFALAAAVSVFGAGVAAASTAVEGAAVGFGAEDWATACVAISAQLEIKVSLTRQSFTRGPNGKRDRSAR
jgi:hypothetical protein